MVSVEGGLEVDEVILFIKRYAIPECITISPSRYFVALPSQSPTKLAAPDMRNQELLELSG